MRKIILISGIVLTSLVFSAFLNNANKYHDFKLSYSSELSALQIYNSLSNLDINSRALIFALNGYLKLKDLQEIKNTSIITIIDYSKPSTEKRLYIIDIINKKLIYNTYVAHGKNSGLNCASTFSNNLNSNKSSLGFYLTGKVYIGKHGYSLKLHGLENSNKSALDRAIVIHSANYVSKEYINKYCRLGRSFGCPAIPVIQHKSIIDLIKNRSCLFIYFPDKNYLSTSALIKAG